MSRPDRPDIAIADGMPEERRFEADDVLLGRDAELERIRTAFHRLSQRGEALHLIGEPGIGKSELLRAAVHEATERGLRVFAVRGAASESHLSFAALYLLLRPILARANALPAKHRAALLAAFGLLESSGAPERLFVALAALELIADAAAEVPVVVAVDDLPSTDNASREAIEFVARRIEDEPALLLLTSRSGEIGGASREPVGAVLELQGLDPVAARRLLRRHGNGLSAAEERSVLEAAGGNPLALLELPEAMRTGLSEFPANADAPLAARLERAFAVRLHDLAPATRTALLVAALQDGDRLSETAAALSALTGDAAPPLDLEPAVRAELLTLDDDSFRFRHPLVASAVRQGASAASCRKIHLAFAASLTGDPDRATWHRALATSDADEELAAELDAGAARAIARGASDIAEEWLERAAALSVDDRGRGHRLVRAAELAFELGRQKSVHELIAHARTLPLAAADYARLAGLEGAFDDGTPGDEDRVRRLVDAGSRARESGADDVAASLLLGAAMPCYWGAAEERLRAHVRGATQTLALAPSDPRTMVLHALVDPFEKGSFLVDQLSKWAKRDVQDAGLASALARTAFVVGDFERALAFAGRACEGLREQGRVALLTQALVLQTFSALYLGRWEITKIASDEAYRFATETHQPVWQACARLGQANLCALQGDDAAALALAAEVERTAVSANNRSLLNGVQLARGFAALSALRPAEAFAEFARMFDVDDLAYHLPQSAWAIDYFAESAQLTAQHEEALAAVRTCDALTQETSAAGVVRASTLARALLADDEDAERLFNAARRIAANAPPWYCARVDLAFGAWLRRRRRIADSRRPLAAAQAVFEALGAQGWANRAREELAATGQRLRRREPEGWAQLSAQELQIARLAAQGLSNREIGQRLYLSHRTVASHLYRVFPKLGVSSRSQLHLALPSA